MATASTIYDVRVKYHLDDHATQGMQKIEKGAKKAARSTNSLGKDLRRVFALAGGAYGFSKLLKHTVGFNRTLGQTQAQLRTIVQLNTGKTFYESNEAAIELLDRFREEAKDTAGTFQDMSTFASAIAGPITRAGGSLNDLVEISKGATVAAAAFGEKAELAQLDITQALAGTLGSKDRFARAILEPMGLTADAFNKMTSKKRLNTLKEAFNQKAIKDAATAYQSSFEGVFSTFQSQLQEFGGKVGAKLFNRLTVEIQKISKWFDDNQRTVDRWANKFADGMVKGFEYAKKAFGFIIEHKDLLLSLAKAFLVGKAVKGIAGPFLEVGNALTNLQKNGLAGFASKIGGATTALAGLATVAVLIADKIDRDQDAKIKRTTDNPRLREIGQILGTGALNKKGMHEISNTLMRGITERAAKAGLKSDEGSLSMFSSDRYARQRKLRMGKATAADKMAALEMQSFLNESGFVRKDGKINLGKIAQNFGVGDDPASQRALQAAGGISGLSKLDSVDKMVQQLERTNFFNDGETRRMTDFLRGLDVQMQLAGRANAELTAAAVERVAAERGVTVAQVQGEMMAKALKEEFGPTVKNLGNMFDTLLGKGPDKASDAKRRALGNQTKVEKVVIQVESNDPDRFAMGLEGLFSDLAQNGAQATEALYEGN